MGRHNIMLCFLGTLSDTWYLPGNPTKWPTVVICMVHHSVFFSGYSCTLMWTNDQKLRDSLKQPCYCNTYTPLARVGDQRICIPILHTHTRHITRHTSKRFEFQYSAVKMAEIPRWPLCSTLKNFFWWRPGDGGPGGRRGMPKVTDHKMNMAICNVLGTSGNPREIWHVRMHVFAHTWLCVYWHRLSLCFLLNVQWHLMYPNVVWSYLVIYLCSFVALRLPVHAQISRNLWSGREVTA